MHSNQQRQLAKQSATNENQYLAFQDENNNNSNYQQQQQQHSSVASSSSSSIGNYSNSPSYHHHQQQQQHLHSQHHHHHRQQQQQQQHYQQPSPQLMLPPPPPPPPHPTTYNRQHHHHHHQQQQQQQYRQSPSQSLAKVYYNSIRNSIIDNDDLFNPPIARNLPRPRTPELLTDNNNQQTPYYYTVTTPTLVEQANNDFHLYNILGNQSNSSSNSSNVTATAATDSLSVKNQDTVWYNTFKSNAQSIINEQSKETDSSLVTLDSCDGIVVGSNVTVETTTSPSPYSTNTHTVVGNGKSPYQNRTIDTTSSVSSAIATTNNLQDTDNDIQDNTQDADANNDNDNTQNVEYQHVSSPITPDIVNTDNDDVDDTSSNIGVGVISSAAPIKEIDTNKLIHSAVAKAVADTHDSLNKITPVRYNASKKIRMSKKESSESSSSSSSSSSDEEEEENTSTKPIAKRSTRLANKQKEDDDEDDDDEEEDDDDDDQSSDNDIGADTYCPASSSAASSSDVLSDDDDDEYFSLPKNRRAPSQRKVKSIEIKSAVSLSNLVVGCDPKMDLFSSRNKKKIGVDSIDDGRKPKPIPKVARNPRECKRGVPLLIDFPCVGTNSKSGIKTQEFVLKSSDVKYTSCTEDEDDGAVRSSSRRKSSSTIESDSQVFIYPKKYKLISLKRIAKELSAEDEKTRYDWTLAPSQTGDALKQYSKSKHNLEKHSLATINYYTLNEKADNDLTKYPLVYGAVAKKYSGVAKYFMQEFYREYTNRMAVGKTSKGVPLNKDKYTYAPLADGELEIIVHQYWELETTDLIDWRDDVPRLVLKRELVKMWLKLNHVLQNMQNQTNQDKELKQKIVDLTAAVSAIRKFGQFDTLLVPAACLFIIKRYYHIIKMVSCPEEITRWELFMKHCHIHHYMCEYTKTVVMSRYKSMSKFLKGVNTENKAIDSEAQSIVPILSINHIYEMFSNVLTVKSTNRRDSIRDLQNMCNTMLYTVARSIGLFFIKTGIVNNSNTIITRKHLCGFFMVHKKSFMPYPNSAPKSMPYPPVQKVSILEDIVDLTVKNVDDPLDKSKRIRFDTGAKEVMQSYVRYILYASTASAIAHYCNKSSGKIINNNKKWTRILVMAINSFMDTYLCSAEHIDNAPLIADANLEKTLQDNTVLNFLEIERRKENGTYFDNSDDSDSSLYLDDSLYDDDEDDEDNDNSDQIYEMEVKALMRDSELLLPEYIPAKPKGSSKVARGVSKKTAEKRKVVESEPIEVTPQIDMYLPEKKKQKMLKLKNVPKPVIELSANPAQILPLSEKHDNNTNKCMVLIEKLPSSSSLQQPQPLCSSSSISIGGGLSDEENNQNSSNKLVSTIKRSMKRKNVNTDPATSPSKLTMETVIRRHQSVHFTLADKCSRIQCVLCASTSTERLVQFSDTCVVPVCCFCIWALDKETDQTIRDNRRAEIIERVNAKYKKPIGFDVSGINRTWKCSLNRLFTTRSCYNRHNRPASTAGRRKKNTTAATIKTAAATVRNFSTKQYKTPELVETDNTDDDDDNNNNNMNDDEKQQKRFELQLLRESCQKDLLVDENEQLETAISSIL